jgi:hypothetical protein
MRVRFYRLASLLIVFSLVIGTSVAARAAVLQPAPEQASVLTFNSVADAYVIRSSSRKNYGSNASLRVDHTPPTRSYLRFVLDGLDGSTVQSAVLRIYAKSGNSAGFNVHALADNSWSESGITYANAPTPGDIINHSQSFKGGTWVEVDVSSYIKAGGTYNLVLDTTSPTNTNLAARESIRKGPQLVVTVGSQVLPTAVPTSTSTSLPQPTNTLANTPMPTNTPQPTATQSNTPVPTNTPQPTVPPTAAGIHIMRVEYTDYASSRAEVPTWTQKMQAAGINMVALAAGRTEWAYFKWAGHESDWSSAVSDTGIDILADDAAHYGQFAQVNAVIDVYSPNYVSAHPEKAAVNVLGDRSPNLVSTAELVNGEFGQKLLDMVQYIAANYPDVDSLSITELSYRIDGYGPDDLALYSAATGRSDWPRQSNGQVDIDDPSIGSWRSAVLGEFLGRAAALAHQYGKQLYMDVSVSEGNLGLMTNNRGTNYNVMLQNVDKIVVWDYFGEDQFPPEYSNDIAQFLTQFGPGRAILSVGLWGANGSIVSASDFETAIQSSQAGGMSDIWICSGSMMGDAHWQVLDDLWGPH